MRILGIDPGLQATGFGVIDCRGAAALCGQWHYPDHARAWCGAGRFTEPAEDFLSGGITEVVQHYQPTEAVVEIVFVNVNPQSTLLLGQARGAA